MNSELFDNLPFELQNEVYKYVGIHKTAEIIYDLIKVYEEDYYGFDYTEEEVLYYRNLMPLNDWYFNHARHIYLVFEDEVKRHLNNLAKHQRQYIMNDGSKMYRLNNFEFKKYVALEKAYKNTLIKHEYDYFTKSNKSNKRLVKKKIYNIL